MTPRLTNPVIPEKSEEELTPARRSTLQALYWEDVERISRESGDHVEAAVWASEWVQYHAWIVLLFTAQEYEGLLDPALPGERTAKAFACMLADVKNGDCTVSNLAGLALATNRVEFSQSARIMLERGHRMSNRDAQALLTIVESVIKQRVEEQKGMENIWQLLREAQGVVNAFDKKLDIAMWALKDEGYIGRARNH